MPRQLILLCVLLLLASCALEDKDPPPCVTCPEQFLTFSLGCSPCAADQVIDIIIANDSFDTLSTDACSWRLVGQAPGRPFDLTEIQRLDCSAVFPVPVVVAPGETGVVPVELDADALPDLSVYGALILMLELRVAAGDTVYTGEASVTGLELTGMESGVEAKSLRRVQER